MSRVCLMKLLVLAPIFRVHLPFSVSNVTILVTMVVIVHQPCCHEQLASSLIFPSCGLFRLIHGPS